ncbi:MAG: DUF3995 domain-containing protein [Cyclobacteriaceae bacterium]
MIVLSAILAIVFLLLALLHFNWATGNQWVLDSALPTDESGERVLNPGKTECIVVGLGLTAFALFYLLRVETFGVIIPDWILKYGGWLIPTIFMMRAIGDFKYVGLFKKIRLTEFGKRDTLFYSPLCLIIGTIGIIVQLMKT